LAQGLSLCRDLGAMGIMPLMPITQKEIQKIKRIYLEKYDKRISDREASDILTRLINILIIIYDSQ
jgi:hypothetical protein